MSIYAIGDVHGCTRTLRRLLESLPLEADSDRVWLVGDVVGHGPDSTGVLRHLCQLEGDLGDRLTLVLGNHDLRLIAARSGARAPRKVHDLLGSILAADDGAALLDWLAGHPLFHHDDGAALVHAGLLPWWTIDEATERAQEVRSLLDSPRRDELLVALYSGEKRKEPRTGDLSRPLETASVMTTVRTIESDGTLCEYNGSPGAAPPQCFPWFTFEHAHRPSTVVFGHWAALGLRFGDHWMAIDSGCAWGGPLTAVRVGDRRVFQTARID